MKISKVLLTNSIVRVCACKYFVVLLSNVVWVFFFLVYLIILRSYLDYLCAILGRAAGIRGGCAVFVDTVVDPGRPSWTEFQVFLFLYDDCFHQIALLTSCLVFFFFFDRIEIDESLINGSFNMVFLGRSISFTYRNHVNIAVRYYLIADVNRFCILLVFTI